MKPKALQTKIRWLDQRNAFGWLQALHYSSFDPPKFTSIILNNASKMMPPKIRLPWAERRFITVKWRSYLQHISATTGSLCSFLSLNLWFEHAYLHTVKPGNLLNLSDIPGKLIIRQRREITILRDNRFKNGSAKVTQRDGLVSDVMLLLPDCYRTWIVFVHQHNIFLHFLVWVDKIRMINN